MDIPPEVGGGAIRFSLGRATTEAEIDEVLSQVSRRFELTA
jgi:cysteine sulfinate desulfinase/cysteine desulfurase-like protein